jgi:DNA-binding LacI/PurR family transcriptional regulator
MLATLMLRAASTCGVAVPAAMSIVGFDDIPFAASYMPSLTTVHFQIEEMAHRSVAALLDCIEGAAPSAATGVPGTTVVLAPSLVCRESSGLPPPSAGDDKRSIAEGMTSDEVDPRVI